jgi:choline dehydrogenase
MQPRGRGSVRLRSADPADAPRISLPALVPEDIERLGEGYRLAAQIAVGPYVRSLCTADPKPAPTSPSELAAFVIENAYSIPHVVGTCAMGTNPDAGAVVDATGRVHGIDGLMVIDASIMPGPTSGFPNLVTMMLAEHLSARWSAPSARV